MAQRRMFSLKIVGSDAFIDMPVSTQALYFHLGLHADDDGFVNPRGVVRLIGASEDDLKVLIAKRFVLPFENGVIVIKHWKINNLIKNDRYIPTIYDEQKALLTEKDNGAYTEKFQNGSKMVPQVRLGKVRLGKVNIKENTLTPNETEIKKDLYSEFKNVKLSLEEFQKLNERLGEKNTGILIEELGGYLASTNKRYASHYATLLNWARRKVGEHQKTVKQRTII